MKQLLMKHLHLRSGRALALAFIAVATVAGCAKEKASTYVASANAYMAKRDYAAAIVEAKNALQREPDNAEARLLLGNALMDTGDAVGAEAEVRKAIAAGAPDDRTYPLLARALGAQGDYKKLTTELGDRKLGTAAARVPAGSASLAPATVERTPVRSSSRSPAASTASWLWKHPGLVMQPAMPGSSAGGPVVRR